MCLQFFPVMWDKLLHWMEGYHSAHYVNVILLFFLPWQIFSSLGTVLRIVTFTKNSKCSGNVLCTKIVSVEVKLHWHPIVPPHDFLLQTLQFRLVVKELTKGLCWLSGQFQALIEFNSVTEAEIAKLVQRMLLLWLPCLTHYEDKCMTV